MQASRLLTGGLVGLALGCSAKGPTAVVVALSSEPSIPAEVDSLSITVTRGGATKLDQSYTLPADAHLPGTLTLQNESGHDPSDPMLVRIVARKSGTKHHITRDAKLGMVSEHQKLLRVTLESACIDIDCNPDSTCISGACVSSTVDPTTLPDYDGAGDPFGGAGASGKGGAGGGGSGGRAGTSGAAGNGTGGVGGTNLGGIGGASTGGKGGGVGGGGTSGVGGAGAAGKSGASGSGTSGAAGKGGAGAGGASGTSGASGKGGASGASGTSGASGASGSSGVGGSAGGASGASGASGSGGVGGASGASGMAGAAGSSPTAVVQVSVGDSRTCVTMGSGIVKCWGLIDSILGVGTSGIDVWRPKTVLGVSGVIEVASGSFHSCARLTGGAVTCWGDDTNGKLGPQSGTGPFVVPGLGTVVQVAAQRAATCARNDQSEVWCWGSNDEGELGAGPGAASGTPVKVALGANAARITGGSVPCAVLDNGDVRCWAASGNQATLPGVSNPIGVYASMTTDQKVFVIEAGHVVSWYWAFDAPPYSVKHSLAGLGYDGALELSYDYQLCARFGDGSVACGSVDFSTVGAATPVPGVTDAIMISGGDDYTDPFIGARCVVHADGSMGCWGSDNSGQLGIGRPDRTPTPVPVTGLGASQALEVCPWGAAALDASGAVKAWGTMTAVSVYVDATPVSVASAGSGYDLLRLGTDPGKGYVGTKGGAVKQLTNAMPSATDGLAAFGPWKDVVTRVATDAGVNLSGQIVMVPSFAGANAHGVFGNNSTASTIGLPATTTLANVVSVTLSDEYGGSIADLHACAIDTGKTLYCWGSNHDVGAVGTGAMSGDVLLPVQPNWGGATPSIVSVCTGSAHTCAVSDLGAVWCWGLNGGGQLGLNDQFTRFSPTAVTIPPTAEIACRAYNTCARTMTGSVYCWGYDNEGQAAEPTYANVLAPHDVGLPDVALSIGVGGPHACARTATGAYCWGGSLRGQLGNGTIGVYATPQPVVDLALP